MSGFRMPDFSSSPPATPDKRSNNGNNLFSFGASNPSTTPAGPPPSSSGSFTPAGLPPSSFLGSSVLRGSSNPIKPLSFSQKASITSQPNFNTSPQFSPSPNFMKSSADTDFQASRQRNAQPQTSYSEEEDEEDMEEDGQYGYQGEFQQDQNTFEDSYGYGNGDTATDDDDYMDEYQPEDQAGNGNPDERSSSDLLLATPTALKESRTQYGNGPLSTQPRKSTYKSIAKDISSRLGVPAIEESDAVVLNTESIITSLYDEGFAADNDIPLQYALMNIPGELITVWSAYARQTKRYQSEEYTATIGPGSDSSKFAKAQFIGSLALRVYHPEVLDDTSITTKFAEPKCKPLPQTMLEWMDGNHYPYPSQVQEIQVHRPSPANHPQFWDITLNSLLRGGVAVVVNILRTAGWRHASTGLDGLRNSNGQAGYTGVALANVERVIGAAIQVLSQCPAIHEDWNIRGSEWTMFRLRASQALDDLKSFAEGRNRDDDVDGLEAGHSGTFSRTAKKAESQVPWDLYQNLLALYGIIIGESSAIINNSTDWCEATIGLVVWWDEGKEDRRIALGRSRGQLRHTSKDSDAEVYLRKLRRSFEAATAEGSDFQVNTMDPVEVSLAALLESDNESVISILRGWSGPVSSAVAEIASLAGWLPPAEPQSLINMSLDQDDMDLLGLNSSPSKADSTKDQTLITYASSLVHRDPLQAEGLPSRDGWEMAIAILGRLDSVERTEEMIGGFLHSFPLNSSATVDKLWRLLNSIGMTGHAERTAETYAKDLAEHTHKYGEALWYYSLGHKAKKVKDVLDLLISFSLVQSTAYPPEAEMDNHLKRLISSPKNALYDISKMDIEAAELLQKLLSGYATLRKFYTLRDEELSDNRSSQRSSATRMKEAALALLAVITSSDDNIRGGLYDEERGAVVNVDFLLALLGEAMVFVNQPNFSITAAQIDILLKAIEDLQAVGPRIYGVCTGFLGTVIASVGGLKGSTPTDMLRKSTSNVSGTSSFSLVGSSMLASQLKQSMGSSGVLVKANIKRGWDWRQGISAGTTGDDVLRILRLGLAKDLAKAWLLEVDGGM